MHYTQAFVETATLRVYIRYGYRIILQLIVLQQNPNILDLHLTQFGGRDGKFEFKSTHSF
jgi:hypothetical protein